MFSVCRQSSHIFQVTRGMYCTNNKVFLSQENAYMGTFQWILRNEGWFLYVSYSHLVPLVELPYRNCASSSTFFIYNPWTCTLQQNTLWNLGAMLRLTTCRRPVPLQLSSFFLLICGLLAVLLGTVVISGSLCYPIMSVMLRFTVFFLIDICQHGREYNSTPARRLSEAFGIEVQGTNIVTAKQVSVCFRTIHPVFFFFFHQTAEPLTSDPSNYLSLPFSLP